MFEQAQGAVARVNTGCKPMGISTVGIYASHDDTSETKRQILAENEKMEKLCGVRP